VHVDTDEELSRQRAVLRDLVALSAIPAAWTGMDPPAIATGLADELMGLLELDFVFVRLCDQDGAEAAEVTRGDAWKGFPEWLDGHLVAGGQLLRKETFSDVGGSEPCRGIAMQIGVNGAGGVVAAASERSDFPTATDELLLSLAANQAATAFQGARLIQERKRAEAELREARNELEVKVAERTADLRRSEAHLAQLAGEQAALRRVATLVAREASEAEVFTAIADGIGELLGAEEIRMLRYEGDRTAVVVAESGQLKEVLPVGSRHRLGGENAVSRVFRTGRPARIDDYGTASGQIADRVRSGDTRGAVAVPILVEGRHWGAMVTGTAGDEPFPAETESRLGQFTELMAMAIANADARDQLTASRARLLTAGDEARRRVVRDLHDGAQARLVQAIVTLRLAQEALREKDREAEPLVGGALELVERGNAELRELSHGILPTVLAHGGLRAAIGSVVARLDLPVELEVPAERFPAEIEASAYFIVAEALTNVVKHANADRGEVKAFVQDGMLRIEVRDDGIGGADPGGNGLVGMDDRVTALGGRLRIESQARAGTLVAATLPLTAGSSS
jgi:signal transduction histidine kinase